MMLRALEILAGLAVLFFFAGKFVVPYVSKFLKRRKSNDQ